MYNKLVQHFAVKIFYLKKFMCNYYMYLLRFQIFSFIIKIELVFRINIYFLNWVFKFILELSFFIKAWEGCGVIVFNATFNNASVILVEEMEVPGENHWPATSH